jgi:hypothetical protein
LYKVELKNQRETQWLLEPGLGTACRLVQRKVAPHVEVLLRAGEQEFDGWLPHAEVGSSENGHEGEG